MPAAEEKSIEPGAFRKVGILAGGGEIPALVLEACERRGIEAFVVAFEGQTDPALVAGRQHLWARLGAVGTVLKTLRNHDVSDLVLIGAIRRPSLAELRPDLKAAAFFAKAGMGVLGDDGLLKALRGFLEGEGFCVHGAQHFARDLLAPEGKIGRVAPNAQARADIRRGLEVLQGLGALDVGQAAIVQEGIVLGVEAVEGTDALIVRCRDLHRKGAGGVLVKVSKPGQDPDLDLPTVGPRTVELAAEFGLSGVAVHAGFSFLLRKQRVAEIADRHKIFVVGIDPSSYPDF